MHVSPIGPASSRVRLATCCAWSLAAAALITIGAGPEAWNDQRHLEPFVCRADFPLDRREPLLRSLQLLRRDVVELLAVRPSAEPVELYLFRDKGTYRGYLNERYPDAPQRRALFIKGDGPGMVFAYESRDLDIDLRHETTHAILHTALAEVPLWLDEGLAEYFEVAREERLAGHPHLASVRWALWHGLTPLAELEARAALGQLSRRDYRDAWAWVHFMLHGPGEARQELVGYLIDLRSAQPSEPLSARLARRLLNLEERFHDHFRESATETASTQ